MCWDPAWPTLGRGCASSVARLLCLCLSVPPSCPAYGQAHWASWTGWVPGFAHPASVTPSTWPWPLLCPCCPSSTLHLAAWPACHRCRHRQGPLGLKRKYQGYCCPAPCLWGHCGLHLTSLPFLRLPSLHYPSQVPVIIPPFFRESVTTTGVSYTLLPPQQSMPLLTPQTASTGVCLASR